MSNAPCVKTAEKEASPEEYPRRNKKYRGRGYYKTGWNQDNLHKIIKAICRKCPGITTIQIEKNIITWNYECTLDDLIPPTTLNKRINPSKRKGEEINGK